MATFSCWTVGPAKISKCGHLFGKDEQIGISPVHSWMNFILTTGLLIFHFIDLILFIFFPTMVLAILVTMIFLLHGDYILCCQCCSGCSCCTISNCNNIQYTVLNTTTMEEEFPIQKTMNQPTPIPSNMCCICSSNCCRNCLSYFFVSLLIASLFIGIGFPIANGSWN